MPQYAYVHICHTHLYNWSILSCYSSKAGFSDCYSELTLYTVLANFSGLVFTIRINAKAMPINDNDYSWHITAIELV